MADRPIDAIRYIALRRMAPGICHKMFGGVQTVQFATELCRRKLHTSTPAEIDAELVKIASHATEVAKACRSFADRLWPDASPSAAFGEALAGCLKLTSDDWTLRGIKADVHVSPAAEAAIVSRWVVGELVSIALLALIDACGNGLDIALTAEVVDSEVVLDIVSRPSTREATPPPLADDKLDWNDVLMLAGTHGVKCICDTAHSSITLHFAQRLDASAGQTNERRKG